MADAKISAFSAASALTGPELAGGVQSAANAKITMTQIKDFCRPTGVALDIRWGSPISPINWSNTLTGSATRLDDNTTTNDSVGVVIGVDCDEATMLISHVGYYVSAITGTPNATASGYRISLQGITTGGLPDGNILDDGGGAASVTFTADNNTLWHWQALDNDYLASRNQQIALCIERVVAASGNDITVAPRWGAGSSTYGGPPYALTRDAGGAWTKATNPTPQCQMAIKNSGATVVRGFPINTSAASTLGTTTERGMLFTVPTNICAKFKVKGIRWVGTSPPTASTFTVNLYTSPRASNPVIAQTTGQLDSDFTSAVNTANVSLQAWFPESSLTELSSGVEYAIGISCSSATTPAIIDIAVTAVADFNAYFGRQATISCSRTLASAYPPDASDGAFAAAASNLVRPILELILSDIS